MITIPGQSEAWNNAYEGVLYTPQIFKSEGFTIRYSLVSYTGHSFYFAGGGLMLPQCSEYSQDILSFVNRKAFIIWFKNFKSFVMKFSNRNFRVFLETYTYIYIYMCVWFLTVIAYTNIRGVFNANAIHVK